MSQDGYNDDELQRFLNDPEYRKKKLAERAEEKKAAFSLKKPIPEEPKKPEAPKSSFTLKKESDTPSGRSTPPASNPSPKPSGFGLPSTSGKTQVPTSASPKPPSDHSPSEAKATSSSQKKEENAEAFALAAKLEQQYKQGKSAPSAATSSSTSPVIPQTAMQEQSFLGAFAYSFTLFLVVGVIAGALAFLTINWLSKGLPSLQELENPKNDIASFVKSRDGETLDKYFTENRTYVRYENISPHIIDALVAAEDHRFYDHWGVDILRTMAAPIHILRGRVQGGSTITQQLARNLYRKVGREVSVVRKLKEILTAIQIERNYTKREILEMYLNTVEFSNSAFGIEAASLTHYGKPAKDLNLIESATMVGTVNAVYAYNPRLFPERSRSRRNVVLMLMNKHGFISEVEYNRYKEEPIVLDYHPPFKTGRKSRYFGEFVRQRVEKWAVDNGYDLYRDGLVIYTTIDSRMQRHAEEALSVTLDTLQTTFEREWTSREHWNKPDAPYMDRFWKQYPLYLDEYIEKTRRYKNGFFGYKTRKEVLDSLKLNKPFVDSVMRANTKLQASFVAIEPSNGHILAWVGGKDYGNVQFDYVHQSKRQAGSTFKPFVYTVAIDNGYPPYYKVSKFPMKFVDRRGKRWDPSDETIPKGPDMVTLSQALARSMNNATVRLLPELAGAPTSNKLEDLFPAGKKIMDMAQNLGIKSKMEPYPSIALGTSIVSLLEMVSAYTTYANKGVHIEPIAITRIEDKEGNLLVEYFPEYQREVISPETAYIMIDMLRGVIRGVKLDANEQWALGTGIRLRNVYGVRQDIAGKTGTTNNSSDNWFIGMMPHIVMGSWVGGEDYRMRFPTDLANSIGQGARTALPIVGEFIVRATSDPNTPWSYEGFEPPAGFVMPEEPKEPIQRQQQRRVRW